MLPLFTLASVPFRSWLQESTNPGLLHDLLKGISYQDLLVVAFTLTSASAVDALISGRNSGWSLFAGIFTLFISLGIMFIYFSVREAKGSIHQTTVVGIEQGSYVVAVSLSFACEICSAVWGV